MHICKDLSKLSPEELLKLGIEASNNAAFNEGLNIGLASAKTILLWWSNNHKNLVPYSEANMLKWSQDELARIESQKKRETLLTVAP